MPAPGDYNSAAPVAGQHQQALAVDVGSARALVPALALEDLELRTGEPIARLFDLIVGCSAGGMIALWLAHPAARSGTAREICSALLEPTPIGRVPTTSFARRAVSLVNPERQSKQLSSWLEGVFGELRLSEAQVRVIVPTYELSTGRLRLFDSKVARTDPGGRDDPPFAAVAHAALAAPPYVAPVRISEYGAFSHDVLIDAAQVGANAALLALAAMQPMPGPESPLLLSLGGGHAAEPLDEDAWRNPKLLPSVLEAMQATLAELTSAVAERTLGPRGFVRIEPRTEERGTVPEQTEDRAMLWLQDTARRMIDERSSALHALASQLSSSRPYARGA